MSRGEFRNGEWEEGRGKREEGSGNREVGRGKRGVGRGKRGVGRGWTLTEFNVVIFFLLDKSQRLMLYVNDRWSTMLVKD